MIPLGGAVALVLLADSRLPAGGHAHSGGMEAALDAGLVRDPADLSGFLRGRLWTAGLVAAGLAAAAARQATTDGLAGWAELDAEADARMPSPVQRAASRQQGRALLRAGRAAWPGPVLAGLAGKPGELADGPAGGLGGLADGLSGRAPGPGTPADGLGGRAGRPGWPAGLGGPHHPVALGAVTVAAGGDPAAAALAAGYLAVSGPATAAIRLRGFDPLAVHAVLAGLAADIEAVAGHAVAAAAGPLVDLPCPAAPRLDLLAELHARSEVRLFAS
ncbi:MAG: urease accessory protein [Mycobacteriales bacterium]|jgi:urease accessory protein